MNKKRSLQFDHALKLELRGPGVRRGRIAVPDLIKICGDAQNLITKQAEVMKGKKTIHPGPTSADISDECTLELVAIKDGSTILEFEFAKPQMHLHFKEQFGAKVIAEVATTIQSLGKRKMEPLDPGLLLSLYNFSGLVENDGIETIRWITSRSDGHKPASVPITKSVREKTAARLSRPQRATVQIDGILDMADFKEEEFKCRIDPPIGVSITCLFDEDHADDIYRLLRSPVRACGEATLKPYTDRIDQVRIDKIVSLPSLHLGEGNFFANPSLGELATLQKVKPINNLANLTGGVPDDEDIDDLVAGIYAARK